VNECINLVSRTLDDRSLAKHAIQCALDRKAICTTEVDGEKLIQPLGAAIIEGQLESRIRALLAGQLSIFSGSPELIKASIEQYEEAAKRASGYSLTDQQKSAVSMALLNRVSIITGFGGTGKTTVLRAVSEIALSQHRPVRLLALSGKAKERAREATGIDAYTIHGLIQAIQKETSSISASGDPLIIIDEASMVDISLMNKLLRLFDKNSFSLLMVGDTGQISPVGFGLFWHKLAKDKVVPITNLTKVHRTAEEGDLHKIAMQIREGCSASTILSGHPNCRRTEGQLPELRTWNGEDQGVYIVPCYPTGKALAGKLHEIKTQLPDAQIITPHMSA